MTLRDIAYLQDLYVALLMKQLREQARISTAVVEGRKSPQNFAQLPAGECAKLGRIGGLVAMARKTDWERRDLARAGGLASAAATSAEERIARGRRGAAKRWSSTTREQRQRQQAGAMATARRVRLERLAAKRRWPFP